MPTHRPQSLALLIILCLPLSALASPALQHTEAKGSITGVTVYQNLARVTRQISFNSQIGSHHILLSDLPGNLSSNSIQASGSDGLQIGSVSSQQVFSTELNNSHEQALVDQIQALRDTQRVAQDRIEAARTQQTFIKSISVKPGKEDSGLGGFYASPEAWSKAWRAIGMGMDETQTVVRQALIESRQLDASIRKLEQELKQIRSNRRHSSSITIAGDAHKSGRHTIEVSYDVPNAWWRPTYRAALNTETGKLALTLKAELRQNTGEDWTGVKVSLNTGRPSRATQLPILEPWLLSILEPRQQALEGRRAMKMMSMDAADSMAAPAMEDEMSVQIVEKSFAASYILPGKVSLNSDNKPLDVSIETHALPVELELQSVPKRDPSAYLVARFSLPEGRTFPPGKVVLTRDGDYVGDAGLPDIPAGKPIEFGFGNDEKLVVEYRRLPDESETSGFKLIGKSEVITHRYVIKLQNRHKRALPLKVFDQLPVSTDERIEVSPLWDKAYGGQPPQQDVDDRRGVVAWSWTLAPAADQELRFGYSIKYPQGLVVPGI